MMLWFMPILLAWFTLSFPSGLALYWLISNVIGTLIQLVITGKIQSLFNLNSKLVKEDPEILIEDNEDNNKSDIHKDEENDESSRDNSKNNRRSNRHRSGRAKRKQRRSRN